MTENIKSHAAIIIKEYSKLHKGTKIIPTPSTAEEKAKKLL